MASVQNQQPVDRAQRNALNSYETFARDLERRARTLRFLANWLPDQYYENEQLRSALYVSYGIENAEDLSQDALRNLLLSLAEKHLATAEEAIESGVESYVTPTDLSTEEILRARAKFVKLYSDQSKRRRNLLRQYIEDNYGNDRPWRQWDVQDLFDDIDEGLAWAERAYRLQPFEARDGYWFKTTVSADEDYGEIVVEGKIWGHNGDGNWTQVGNFTRMITSNGEIKNDRMFITDREYKNKGFQTVFNPHAWMWAQAANFDRIQVSTADDGPYVWGRVGFRGGYDDRLDGIIQSEIDRFRSGEDSILRTDLDADMMEYLLIMARIRGFDEIGMPEFIVAMSDYYDLPEDERKQREQEIKEWWHDNHTIDSGYLELRDEYFDEMYNPVPRP